MPKHVEGSPSWKGLKKLHSISNTPAGAGCWARLWGCLPAGIFVIFFNILSSFYWSGKYLALTSYKSRLFLNIRWIYLLANCSVCAVVESQVVPFARERAEPGYEHMGTRAWHRGGDTQTCFVNCEMSCKIQMFLFTPVGTAWLWHTQELTLSL